MELLPDTWHDIWALETPLLELLVRAMVLYLGILMILRIMPRRTGGELATMDLVLILLVTECAAHSLGDYTSLGDGLVMIVSVMGLNYLVNATSSGSSGSSGSYPRHRSPSCATASCSGATCDASS